MHSFARFHQRLQEKGSNMAARPVIYTAIGDSVTQGAMEEGVIEHQQVYHQLLRLRIAKHYPNSIVNVINAGVGGETAEQSRKRWERDVIHYQPDLVTIKFGLNDAHGGEAGLGLYIDAISDLVHLIKKETESDILLLTPSMMMKKDNPRISEGHQHHIPRFIKLYEEEHLIRYVQALRQFAAQHAIPLLDVYAMWEKMDKKGIDIHNRLANGINHPDRPFHHELAAELEKMLFPV